MIKFSEYESGRNYARITGIELKINILLNMERVV
jgi:hypothetical protein